MTYLSKIMTVMLCMAFAPISLGQIPACGGSCGGGTAPVCITSTASVIVVTPCTGNDLEITVIPGAGQTPAVAINVYASNLVFNEIRVRIPVAGTAVGLTVQPAGSGSIAEIGSIYQVPAPGGNGELWIGQIIADEIESVDAASINIVRALAGNIGGPIVAHGSPSGGQGIPGTIDTVQADLGNILGDIYSEHSLIKKVLAPSGNIGSSIYTPYIGAKTNIQRVEAERIWADIDALANGGSGSDSQVWRVAASVGNFTGSIQARQIEGSSGITPGIFVPNGDLDADIVLTDTLRRPIVVGGALPSNRGIAMLGNAGTDGSMTFGSVEGVIAIVGDQEKPITVDGELSGLIYIGGSLTQPICIGSTGNPGLSGQVVINGSNTSETWAADVTVEGCAGDVLATTPYYDNRSSDIGGGAVGLVPYHLHQKDCEPPHGPDGIEADGLDCLIDIPTREWPASHGGGTRETLILRHYGPVFDAADGLGAADDPETVPLIIERRGLILCYPTPCPEYEEEWTDRTERFDVYVPPGTPPNYSREVWVALKLDQNDDPQPFSLVHRYRVSLVEDEGVTQLRSGGTLLADEDAPNVERYPYEFNPYCEFTFYRNIPNE